MLGRSQAHRLDEYLQQTMLEIEPTRIVLHLDLTPGVDVATDIAARIDADHDGTISAVEEAAYTEQVRRDLQLSVRSEPLAIRTMPNATYPTLGAMMAGLERSRSASRRLLRRRAVERSDS